LTRARFVSPQDSFGEAKARLAIFSIECHDLTTSAEKSRTHPNGDLLDVADSLKASSTSLSLSLGKARATLRRWRHETAVDVNFAL
jgi:hypothetical protein